MNILITGINGYVGKAIYNSLKLHYNVYGAYNTSLTNQSNFFKIDLTDAQSVNSFINENKDFKIDTVIHLASKMASGNNLNDVGVLTDNIKMTENICRIANAFSIKHFLNFSSSSVYPNINGVFNESSTPYPALNNDFIYGLSKLNAEYLCDFMLNKTITVTHLRVAMIFGDEMNGTRLIPVLKKELDSTNTITLYGNGKRQINYIYIEDLVRVVNFFIVNPKNDIVNVSTNCETTLTLAENIIKKYGNQGSKIVLKGEGNQLQFKLDSSKLNTILNKNV